MSVWSLMALILLVFLTISAILIVEEILRLKEELGEITEKVVNNEFENCTIVYNGVHVEYINVTVEGTRFRFWNPHTPILQDEFDTLYRACLGKTLKSVETNGNARIEVYAAR